MRPKHQNRLNIKASSWYSADALVAAGFDNFCCADRVALLLASVEDWGVSIREVDSDFADPLERRYYRHRTQFKFTSRKRAKTIRRELVRIDSIVRLGGLYLHEWITCCECSQEGRAYGSSGMPRREVYTRVSGKQMAEKIKATYTRSGKKR